MSNTLSIFRRDLAAYFTSPIGYIFIMVFVTISVGLYITSFFMYPVADMRPFFENLPLLLCVFIPAVTMRIWAEERKENTWEMLLTFPMKPYELVLGKFFAALVFFGVALLATCTVPAMLMSLGNPDIGAMLSGYLGTLLLGGMFLAMGIFFSGFFKDQIVAFVVTLLACFTIFLIGMDYIASVIDATVPGVGSLLANLVGLTDHFVAFPRGVIEIADVVYFLVWTILFLVLNILYIDGRSRPGARTLFGTALLICLAIGFLFNYVISGMSLVRADVTEDEIYTVSPATERILAQIDTPVTVTLYITKQADMPTQYRNLEDDITAKLEEMRVASNGNLRLKTAYLQAANVLAGPQQPGQAEEEEAGTEEEAIEKRLLSKGVEPFSVQALSEDEMTNKVIYSSIGIAYRDKPEEVINQIVPERLPQLEYLLSSNIYKMSLEEKPVIALVAPTEAINIPPELRQMYMQMGQQIPTSEDPYEYVQQLLSMEKYDVQRVELSKENPLPEEYDTLAVINPRSLNERQQWEINRALRAGKNVVMAVQMYEWDYQVDRQVGQLRANRRDENPEVNGLLEKYGLSISEDVLMDVNKVPLRIQTGSLQDMISGGQPIDAPTHVLVQNATMEQDSAITNRLAQVFYLWGTALGIDEAKLTELGLTHDVLMTSSDQAWTQPADAVTFAEPPADERKAFPLMAVIQGQFPDAFEGQERPAWPKPEQQPGQPPMPEMDDDEPPASAVTPAPGKLILLGCSEMFRKNFLQAGNLDLFLNMVDGVTLTEDLALVRNRKPIDRTIAKPSDTERTVWKLANYGLANIIIASIGIGLAMARRRSRNAYTMQYANRNND
jgi:ABC-type transport system involved in multi-copper enzyme maturation permease subunit